MNSALGGAYSQKMTENHLKAMLDRRSVNVLTVYSV